LHDLNHDLNQSTLVLTHLEIGTKNQKSLENLK